jgi:superfamily II DNA or RNA helicase
MNLSRRLAGNFSGAVRQRGQSYFWQGRVRIRDGSESDVAASVRGSQNYEVSLVWHSGDGVLSANCDCLYFDSDGPCKHLWAAILAAESDGYLAATAAAPKLTLNCGDYGFDEESEEEYEEGFPLSARRPMAVPPAVPKSLGWRKRIAEISHSAAPPAWSGEPWPAKRQVLYTVDVAASLAAGSLIIFLSSREHKLNGGWTRSKILTLRRSQITQLPLPEDREILSAVAGGVQYYGWSDSALSYQVPSSCILPHPLAGMVMPLVARTGRCYLRKDEGTDQKGPLTWDEGGAWRFGVDLRRSSEGGWAAAGVLRRGEERLDLAEPLLMTKGLIFTRDRVAPLAEDALFDWMVRLRKAGAIEAPEKERDELLAALLSSPGLPAPEVPEELRYEDVTAVPRPGLQIRTSRSVLGGGDKMHGELSFDYDGRAVPALDRAQGFYDAASRRFMRRNLEVEKAATDLLSELGMKFQKSHYGQPEDVWEIPSTRLPRIVRTLVEAGWHIEAQGKVFRRPGGYHIEVSTGVDWFELHGKVEYGDTVAQLPELLAALQRGENMVRLDDGTYGLLPEDWMRRIGVLAGMGTPESSHVRFRRSQAGFLDALLAAEPDARCDETFARVREELGQFQGIESAAQPEGFVGRLRDYQREGLGWMQFLQRFSFGGCLADDMGVGKTAQVLALLETRRELRDAGQPPGPSLVVVPRSLVFNWKEESARFTPRLRVLDYTGVERSGTDFADSDVILTTYGTLRRDVLKLKEVEFDYVVLDEAQAVKNSATDAAKAVRLLRAAHRLALSGTPVENHLGELWSLFEFLNPGMLGTAGVFKLVSAGRNPTEDTCRLLAHALRPFILRRTKEQVARELPPKTEQTLYCEMEPAQRKLYQELRQHYRDSLLKRIETEGLAKSKIQVLEALLRLRQAACHPGLIDKKRSGESSAKLETLLEQLNEVLDEGHKALVFSQFTSLLRIVRDRLDSQGVAYQYLDGATRDRKTPVDRFQNDPACKLFLVSLKAGGLGLNLTAADYVFLLDPWWNPAVETQAIDRAHRIGQTQQVFAYRIIARDTVEEKVLELQNAKRDLAAAIIRADNSLIRSLRREDLELLLS